MDRRRLLIVAHAPSDNTRRMLDAVKEGARSPEFANIEVAALNPFSATVADVLSAKAIILGTTENIGTMSGALKDFFDRIYDPCLERTQGLPYAAYIRGRSDGTGTRRGIEAIATGLRWRAVSEPIVCRGKWDEAFVGQCQELGAAMAAGLDLGIF